MIVTRSLCDSDVITPYSNYLLNKPQATFFHTIYYYNSMKKTPGVNPVSIVLSDSYNNVKAAAIGELANEISFIPYFTKRLILYAHPLFETQNDLIVLLKSLNQINAGLFIQIRSFSGFSDDELAIYNRFGYVRNDHLNAYISLKGMSDNSIFEKFKKDKRKGIRNAERRYKLTIQETSDTEYSVDIFYDMLKKLYRRKRHAMKNKTYFLNLINESNGNARIAFAVYKDTPIAVQLYVIYKSHISAMYTATLKEHMNKHAGDLLVWYLIKKGIEHGCDIFDFGGGGDPAIPYSPRDYKARFGTEFHNVGRLNLPKSFLYRSSMWLYKKFLKS